LFIVVLRLLEAPADERRSQESAHPRYGGRRPNSFRRIAGFAGGLRHCGALCRRFHQRFENPQYPHYLGKHTQALSARMLT
jgi:hypothetical protein